MKLQLAGIIGSFALLTACRETPPRTEGHSDSPPVLVRTVTINPTQLQSGYEASGTVKARTTAVLASKVMGYVREVKVQAGDHVREGQTLLSIDSRDLDANYSRAAAGREEAVSATAEVQNAVAGAKANLDLAQVTFDRMKDLYSKKSISNQEFDEASTKLRAAQASYEIAKSKGAQLQSRILGADAERRSAEIMRSYSTVAAPFAGVITAKTAEPGILAVPGAALFTIEREGTYRLEVPVEESKLALVRMGGQVEVKLDALNRSANARVSEIVPAVDPASRSYMVKIDLPPLAGIRSGLYGRATFQGGSRTALVIPATAITERGQLDSVMVAENGVARTRLITAGERRNGNVEVLSGLSPGESIVFPVPANLADGMRVEVRQ